MNAAAFILIGCMVLFAAGIYAANSTGAKPNGNMLLGVTLPYDALKDEAAAGIVSKYKKAFSAVVLIFLLLTAPVFFTAKYISITMLYMLAWFAAFMYFNQKTVGRYSKELYSLKRANGWWTGARSVISVDTEVSRIKNLFPVSKKWFVVPLIITAVPAVFIWLDGRPGFAPWILPLCGAVTLLSCMFVYHLYSKDRTVVYSDDTEVNIALNRAYKREWTKCWVIVAYLSSVIFTAAAFLSMTESHTAGTAAVIVDISSSLLILVPIRNAYGKVRETRNRLLRLINEEVYTDDDEYWINGAMFYNNPNDGRVMVEKRMGYGMTVNMASAKAKISVYAVLAGAAAFIAGLAIYLTPLDFGSVTLTVRGRTVTVSAPMQHYTFSANDIKSVALSENFPAARKAYGADSARFLSGRFNVTGYGAGNVYIYRKNPLYIAVELTDTSSLLGPNTLLNTLFSNTLSLRSSLSVSDRFHTHTKPWAKL
jgi:uncharacterized membrane protein